MDYAIRQNRKLQTTSSPETCALRLEQRLRKNSRARERRRSDACAGPLESLRQSMRRGKAYAWGCRVPIRERKLARANTAADAGETHPSSEMQPSSRAWT